MARPWVQPTGFIVRGLMLLGFISTIAGLTAEYKPVFWAGYAIWVSMFLIEIMYVLFRTKWHKQLFVDMAVGGYPTSTTRPSDNVV